MGMTPEQKAAYDLRKKGHSMQEIAFALGVTKGTVEKRLTRAQKWLDASDGQVAAMEAWDGGKDFKDMLQRDEEISRTLGREEIDGIFDLAKSLQHVDYIFRRAGLP